MFLFKKIYIKICISFSLSLCLSSQAKAKTKTTNIPTTHHSRPLLAITNIPPLTPKSHNPHITTTYPLHSHHPPQLATTTTHGTNRNPPFKPKPKPKSNPHHNQRATNHNWNRQNPQSQLEPLQTRPTLTEPP